VQAQSRDNKAKADALEAELDPLKSQVSIAWNPAALCLSVTDRWTGQPRLPFHQKHRQKEINLLLVPKHRICTKLNESVSVASVAQVFMSARENSEYVIPTTNEFADIRP
jgi:hypothetical protein